MLAPMRFAVRHCWRRFSKHVLNHHAGCRDRVANSALKGALQVCWGNPGKGLGCRFNGGTAVALDGWLMAGLRTQSVNEPAQHLEP